VVMTDLVNTAPILGGAFFIPENNKYLHNQRLGLVSIRDSEKIDKKYLYYALNYEAYRAQVRGSASGATVRHTAPERIYRCRIECPTLVEQSKIATVLSLYDDFIENNLRRIELLENAARLIYKEWFVKLNFPGREHTRIVNEMPVGWEKKKIGEVAPFNYGKALKADNRVEGKVPVYGSSGIVGSHETALVEAPGIIIGRKGNVGSVFWSAKSFWPIDTVYYIGPGTADYFLFFKLQNQHFINSDVAVPGLNRNYAHNIELILPSKTIRREFNELLKPIYLQIENMQMQINKLRQARDMLLPKLMSGEIAV
jgi:type I restriction enzyme S subunit